MKAALLEDFGKPLIIGEVADPEPGLGQIVVRVEACGLCHSDLHLARGEWEAFKARMPVPAILGHEISGRVARLGPGAGRFHEGARVGVPWFHWTCGVCRYCRQDLEVFCDRSEITGVTAEVAAEWFGTPENRVDAALVCATSTSAYESAFAALRKNGTLVVVGLPSRPLSWSAADLIRSGTRIIPSRVASRREIAELLALAAEGKIHSETQGFRLEQINSAIAGLEQGTIAARAVIHPY